MAQVAAQISRSQALVAQRREQLPTLRYPEELPISERRAGIAALIAAHPVVVLCGETGSGKSTQLPKICLELGRGVFGRIGHTQPRRIAARTLAARISAELGRELGDTVGYKVRFHDQVRPHSQVKLLTDGMLLAEIQQDRYLNEYDTLIIDEAHERSLNIDFLLGYLQQLLPKRPDLKLIITSATIDPERFAEHFGGAPIVNVSGRTYPVEIRYAPPRAASAEGEEAEEQRFSERDEEMQQAILEAVDRLSRIDRGDILIFLSGEREIRETAESLRKHRLQRTEVLPLYARLSVSEQQQIFNPSGERRIVLATNVAETSLTVPGIRYVIDTGYARISRYSHRSKVQRLPVERIAQASANQRTGRCGRVAAGVCIRLYSEADYLSRHEFTEPEILRTNLASVILQMMLLGFGDIGRFPFVDPPDPRLIKDGYRVLEEIGAVDGARKVTRLGRKLARLPVDPRIGRMLLEAAHNHALREVLIIAAALTIQDPRDRPHDKQQMADEAHREFVHAESDFLTYVQLWDHLEERRRHLSKRKFRDECRQRFLSWVRVQEWHDIHQQLRSQLHEMGYTDDKGGVAGDREQLHNRSPLIHRAILSGLLSHIGCKDSGSGRDYLGARNSRFHLFPGSGQFKRLPKWVVAAELVETTRLYARNVAAVQPEWIEAMAGHLLKRSYSEPHWEKRRGQVAASERVTLFGLVLVPQRKVNFGPIDPVQARELFLRFALVEGDFASRAPFWRHNQELIEEVRRLEAKERRRDLLVESDQIYAFYANRVPDGIYSTPQFNQWLQQVSREQPKLLQMTLEDLLQQEQREAERNYPDRLSINGMALPLEYRFDPTHQADGVTLRVPQAVLNQVTEERCQWLVPGLLRERVIALLRALPKSLRRTLVPIPETADACLRQLTPSDRPLVSELGGCIKALTGVHIPEEAWEESSLPDHLRMNVEVLDGNGQPLASGRDLAQLKQCHAVAAEAGGWQPPAAKAFARDGITRWDFGDLPIELELNGAALVTGQGGAAITLRGYPALLDSGDAVALRLLDTRDAAEQATRGGLCRLLQLALPQEMRYLRKNLPGITQMALAYSKAAKSPVGATAPQRSALEAEVMALVVELAFLHGEEPLPRSAAAFAQTLERGTSRLIPQSQQTLELLQSVFTGYQQVRKRLAVSNQLTWFASIGDMQQQLDHLVFQGFLRQIPYVHLENYPRYLKALQLRLDKLHHAASRDQQRLRELQPLLERWQGYQQRLLQQQRSDPRLEEIRWMLEELRISLFAQEVGTAYPVSTLRVQRRWEELGL